jgi:hypothetical protein
MKIIFWIVLIIVFISCFGIFCIAVLWFWNIIKNKFKKLIIFAKNKLKIKTNENI